MKRIVFFLLLITSLSAQSVDWVLVDNYGQTRVYVASNQITRDEGGLKFFVKETYNPPLVVDGKKYDQIVNLWWVNCSRDEYKLGPEFRYYLGKKVGFEENENFKYGPIPRNTGIRIYESWAKQFDYVCRSFR